MLISNQWLSGLFFVATVSARVAPATTRNTCSVDSCSKALLGNADAAASFCKSFGKTAKRQLAPRSPAETCAPATLLPYPEFASPCFENGQDVSRVSTACDCLSYGSSSPAPTVAAGSNQAPGSQNAGANGSPISTVDIVTTEIVFTTVTVCPVTTTVQAGRSSVVQTTDSTSTVESTITITICTSCLASTDSDLATSYAAATTSAGNGPFNGPFTQTSTAVYGGKTVPDQNHPVYYNSTGPANAPYGYPTASSPSGHQHHPSGISGAPGSGKAPFPSGSAQSTFSHNPSGSAAGSGLISSPTGIRPSGAPHSSIGPSYSKLQSPSESGLSSSTLESSNSGAHGLTSASQYGSSLPYKSAFGTGSVYSTSILPSASGSAIVSPSGTGAPYSSGRHMTVGSSGAGSASGSTPKYPPESYIASQSGSPQSVNLSGIASTSSLGPMYTSGTSTAPIYPFSTGLSYGSGIPSSNGVSQSGTAAPYSSGSGSKPIYPISSGTGYTNSIAGSGPLTPTYPFNTGSPSSTGPKYSSGTGSAPIYPSGTALSSGTGSAPIYPSGTALSSGTGSAPIYPSGTALSSGTGPKYPSGTALSSGTGTASIYPSGTAHSSGTEPKYPSGSGSAIVYPSTRNYTSGTPPYPSSSGTGAVRSSGSGSPSGTGSTYVFGSGTASLYTSGTGYPTGTGSVYISASASAPLYSTSAGTASSFASSASSSAVGSLSLSATSLPTSLSSIINLSLSSIPTSASASIVSLASSVPLTSACESFILQVTGSGSGIGSFTDGQYLQLAGGPGADDQADFVTDVAEASTFMLTGAGQLTSSDGTSGMTETANLGGDFFTGEGLEYTTLLFDSSAQYASRSEEQVVEFSTCIINNGILSCTTGPNNVFYSCLDDTGLQVGPRVEIGCQGITLNVILLPSAANKACVSAPVVSAPSLSQVLPIASATIPASVTSAPVSILPSSTPSIPTLSVATSPATPSCSALTAPPDGINCDETGIYVGEGSNKLLETGTAATVEDCAAQCTSTTGCLSIGFSSPAVTGQLSVCNLYQASVADLDPEVGVQPVAGQALQNFYDIGCFACSTPATTNPSTSAAVVVTQPSLTSASEAPVVSSAAAQIPCVAVESSDSIFYGCDLRGEDVNGITFYYTGEAATEEACASQCLDDLNCQTFAYGSDSDPLRCELSEGTPYVLTQPGSSTVYFQRQCFSCVADTGGSPAVSATSGAPVISVTAAPVVSVTPAPVISVTSAPVVSVTLAPVIPTPTFYLESSGTKSYDKGYVQLGSDSSGDKLAYFSPLTSATAFSLNAAGNLMFGDYIANGPLTQTTDLVGDPSNYFLFDTANKIPSGHVKAVCEILEGELQCAAGPDIVFYFCSQSNYFALQTGPEVPRGKGQCEEISLTVVQAS